MSGTLDKCKVFVRSISGVKMRCMGDYAQLTLRNNPDNIILHIGTNELPTRNKQ